MYVIRAMRWMSSWLALLLAFALLGPLPLAHAAITTAGDVLPADPSTWDDVTTGYIGQTAAGTLTIDGSTVTDARGYIGYDSSATGLVSISGTGSTWTNSVDLNVGYAGIGTLSITSGGSVSDGIGFIGRMSGATGTVTVDGTGSTWTNATILYVGSSGSGTLHITNGGGVTSNGGTIGATSGSAGEVTVDGSRSLWSSGPITVGGSGSGSLSVTGGGRVISYGETIGASSGSAGTVTVDGSGSLWMSHSLAVGGFGGGLLSITNGGSVTSSSGTIGASSGSVGTVTADGSGSKWTSGPLTVGSFGSGSLSITGGGTVTSSGGTISASSGSAGTVTVDGAGSLWTSGALIVGGSASGSLWITNGGTATSTNATVGLGPSSQGTVTISGAGSKWSSSNLTVGFAGAGSVIQSGGSNTVSNMLYIGQHTRGSGAYDLSGSGYLRSNREYVGYAGIGTFNHSAGTNTIYDRLYVGFGSGTGTYTLDGTGSLILLLPYTGELLIGSGGRGRFEWFCDGLTTPRMTLGGAGTLAVNFDFDMSSLLNGSLFHGTSFTGSGTLEVTRGAAVSQTGATAVSLGHLTLGTSQGSGSYSFTGTGPLSMGTEMIGHSGMGTFTQTGGTNTVRYGGEFYDPFCLGCETTGNGTYHLGGTGVLDVTGQGSSEHVGYSGTGTFIQTGGTNTTSFLELGCNTTGNGVYELSGTGCLTCASAWIGWAGTGTFTQSGGTHTLLGGYGVPESDGLLLAAARGSSGTYNLNGGTLTLKSLTRGSGTATFNFGGGTLRASGMIWSVGVPMNLTGTGGNANVDTNGYVVNLKSALSGIGGLTKSGAGTLTLAGDNDYSGPTTVTAGVVELLPRAQNAVLALGGADIHAGKILFNYYETSPAATILALLTDGYHGGLWNAGQFRNSTAATTGLTLGWLDDPVTQAVTVMATYPGDFNLDGVADDVDMSILVSHLGRRGDWGDGDANYDGLIDLLDWNAWKTSYSLPPLEVGSPTTAGVPEPGTLAMLLVGLLGAIASYGRRRSLVASKRSGR
jgi:fibronectin-binding autotransporter adhesin